MRRSIAGSPLPFRGRTYSPRRHKLRITRLAASGWSHSLRCSSSPQKACSFSGAPDSPTGCVVVLACGKPCALRGRMLTVYQHPCRRMRTIHTFPPAFSNRPPAGLKRKDNTPIMKRYCAKMSIINSHGLYSSPHFLE